MLTNLYRSGQRVFYGPSTDVNPRVQCFITDAHLFGPLSKTHRFSVVRHQPNRLLVAVLLNYCCPSTVFRRITEVVVDSIYAVAGRRPRSHVSHKIRKRVPPAFTYCDSTSAVVAVSAIAWAKASRPHIMPRIVFWRGTLSMLQCRAFSARSAATACQVACVNQLYRAAFALAQPSGLPLFTSRVKLQNSPATKYLAGQVYKVVGAAGRMLSSHLSLLNRFGWLGPARSYDLLVGPFHYSIT